MESISAFYVFHSKENSYFPSEHKIVKIAPNLSASLLRERITLCVREYGIKARCRREGDAEVSILLSGLEIIINDHDKQCNRFTTFTLDNYEYQLQGSRCIIEKDHKITMPYTLIRKVCKEEELRTIDEYDHRYFTLEVGEKFLFRVRKKKVEGSFVNVIPDIGLEFLGRTDNDIGSATESIMLYCFQITIKGVRIITIYRGQQPDNTLENYKTCIMVM